MRTGIRWALDMIAESEIRERLIRFLRDEMSLQEFEDWLVSNSWNMHLDSSPSAQDLVAAIELILSEYSSGHRKYSEVRNEFAALSDTVVITVQISAQHIAAVRAPTFGANSYQAQVPASVVVPA